MLASMYVHAQPGCIVGDRIHRNTRITDIGNACQHCTNNPPNVLLHLLHSHKPVLRLTSNNASGSCFNERDGTLSLHYPGQPLYSMIESDYDFALVSWASASNLVLSTRSDEASIKFATTPASSVTDLERMRITNIGHVGIWQQDPKELLHVGSRMTFHVGYEDDYVGYNVYRTGTGDQLLTGTSSPNQGFPLKYGFSRHGYLEIGAGSTQNGLAGELVDWYEGGSVFDAFAGLTIRNINGNGCASFGKYYPDATTRLYVKAFDGTTMTDALVAVSSTGADLFRVRNGGTVGIAQADPKERLHVGQLMTFHDGGSKFLGFNAWYDATTGQMKNLQANRASVAIGIGDGGANPNVFTITVDGLSSVGQIMNTGFKGISLLTDGSMGIGTTEPESMLHVLGDVTIGPLRCTTSAPGFSSRLSVDGIIFTKELIVTATGWADFVFDGSYALMPLAELRDYISSQRHLPGLPTAEQVAQNGISVSDMQVTLLQKVEELTLYVLQLAAENEVLRAEVRQLQENER